MGGIGQNILREIKEDGDYNYIAPTIEELLKELKKKSNKKKRKVNKPKK